MNAGLDLFAYGLNNPINTIDPSGRDAIVLCDYNFPTHLGALIQDSDGNWWHFYWGTENNLALRISTLWKEVEPYTWCVPYEGNLNLSSINASHQFSKEYEGMVYLRGDFSVSLSEAKSVTGKYDLFKNNCTQVTTRILSQSNTSFKELLSNASKKVFPRSAFNYISNSKSKATLGNVKIGRFRNQYVQMAA